MSPSSQIKLVVEGREHPPTLDAAVKLAQEEVEGFDVVFQNLDPPAGSPLTRIERAAIAAYIVGKLAGHF